jgi:hypothetical protein
MMADMRKALKEARQLGCEVTPVRRTGEILVKHPRGRRQVRINARRKDVPVHLSMLLKRLREA